MGYTTVGTTAHDLQHDRRQRCHGQGTRPQCDRSLDEHMSMTCPGLVALSVDSPRRSESVPPGAPTSPLGPEEFGPRSGTDSTAKMSIPRRRAAAVTMRLAVVESRARWGGLRSATSEAISASKVHWTSSTRSRPAAVMLTWTLRRSSVDAVRTTRPRAWPRSTSPDTLDLSSWERGQFVDGRRPVPKDPEQAGLDDRLVVGGRDAPECPMHNEGELGQRIHQAQIPWARCRGEACWRSVRASPSV